MKFIFFKDQSETKNVFKRLGVVKWQHLSLSSVSFLPGTIISIDLTILKQSKKNK
jgi:ABC-type proline/glycine betaine transport system permease subunit